MMIPRIYTGKPRTTGDGYKGMLHQPNPAGYARPEKRYHRCEKSPYESIG